MEKEDIRDAIRKLDVETIVGKIHYDKEMGGLPYGSTVLCGGQWQRENGELVLKVIDNSLYPEIALTGSYEPVNATLR